MSDLTLLNRPGRFETLVVQDLAPDVIQADTRAWAALDSVLGNDPRRAWELKVMQHVVQANGSIAFHAEFLRRPDEDLS